MERIVRLLCPPTPESRSSPAMRYGDDYNLSFGSAIEHGIRKLMDWTSANIATDNSSCVWQFADALSGLFEFVEKGGAKARLL